MLKNKFSRFVRSLSCSSRDRIVVLLSCPTSFPQEIVSVENKKKTVEDIRSVLFIYLFIAYFVTFHTGDFSSSFLIFIKERRERGKENDHSIFFLLVNTTSSIAPGRFFNDDINESKVECILFQLSID